MPAFRSRFKRHSSTPSPRSRISKRNRKSMRAARNCSNKEPFPGKTWIAPKSLFFRPAARTRKPCEPKLPAPERPVKGRHSLVSPALDPGSTSIEVWVEASKPDPALKPGMTVQLSMTAKTVKDALVVPTPAIYKNPEGTDYVLLVGSDGHARLKTVQVGVRNAEFTQIVSGVAR